MADVCPTCGGDDFKWSAWPAVRSGSSAVPVNRLGLGDVEVIGILSCVCCSETIRLVEVEEIEDMLNEKSEK